jgi:hypothetical protein
MSETDTKITVENGKYTFIVEGSTGKVKCERYGEPWFVFDACEKALIALIHKCVDSTLKLRMICQHSGKKSSEDWPDGGGIEICDTCGMSRHIWEQGESYWIMVEDIPGARKRLQESLNRVRNAR